MNGWKTYIAAGMMMATGLGMMVYTEDLAGGWKLVLAGVALLGVRSALKKIEK